MGLVVRGKKWQIATRKDYDEAIATLEGNAFCAMMCDDYRMQKEEEAEIARQKADVIRQATALGLI